MSSPVEIIARAVEEAAEEIGYPTCTPIANGYALVILSALEREGWRVVTINDIREWSMSRTATLPIPAAPTYGSPPEKQDEVGE